MKIQEPVNPNYAATVVRLAAINVLPNCDNVVGTPVFGYQAIVGKFQQVGDIGILLPPEVQLSEQFCRENNLFRHANLNKDPEAKGYIEDNRRVKALRFRGHQSDALFMPLRSIAFTGARPDDIPVGTTFDTLNGIEICRKYVTKIAREPGTGGGKKAKKTPRVDLIHMPEHPDTSNYFRNVFTVGADTKVIVTQKIHGTSVRIGHTFVTRKLTWKDRLAKRFGVKVQALEHDYVFASRKVIKDAGNEAAGYYSTDVWAEAGEKLRGLLPKNYIVFGEIIGWTSDGRAIQSGYTYDVPVGEQRLYVYRVAVVNEQGYLTELAWDHVKEFCRDLGLLHVPELWRGEHLDFDAIDWMDMNYHENLGPVAIPVGHGKVDEGVCIRIDGLTPRILKAKSPIFLQHETKMLDAGTIDLEEVGNNGDFDVIDISAAS